MKNQAGAKATIGLAFLTLISKILGFVREIVISYMYGASAMSDAYSMANSVAVLIVTGLASGIMTAYIPIAMGMEEGEERNRFTSNILNVIVAVTLAAALICIVFSESIVNVLGMGFADTTKQYTVVLLRFVFVAAVCIFIIYMITGYLNTKGNFSFGGLQLVITNLIFIFVVILSGDNPWYLGIGYLIAYLVPTVLAAYVAGKYGFVHSKEFSFHSAEMKNLLLVSLIAFLGTNVIKFDVMLDRIFASNLSEGTVAAINYAFTLISIFPEVFILSMATVGYPKLSEWHNAKDEKAFGDYVSSLLIQTSLILFPIVIAFLQLGKWAIEIMFQRGAFDASDTLLTADILYGYSYSMLGIGISYILCRAFFARKEEWIPATCLGLGILMNLGLNLIWGQNGAWELSFTTSISVSLSALSMLVLLLVKIKKVNIRYLLISLLKILAASGVMYGVMRVLVYFLEGKIEGANMIAKIVLAGGIAILSFAVYGIMLYLCRVDEAKKLIKETSQKIRKEK